MMVMREGKWKVDKSEWAADSYPTYCSGSAFVMSTDVAVALHRVSYDVPFFWVDDLYVTGLLVLKAGPQRVRHVQFMSTYLLDGRKLAEKFTGSQWYQYIFSHVHDLNAIQAVWKKVVRISNGSLSPTVQYALPGDLQRIALEAAQKDKEQAAKKS
jgi:Galactosyltransferase